jgi:hypothetical protein
MTPAPPAPDARPRRRWLAAALVAAASVLALAAIVAI